MSDAGIILTKRTQPADVLQDALRIASVFARTEKKPSILYVVHPKTVVYRILLAASPLAAASRPNTQCRYKADEATSG